MDTSWIHQTHTAHFRATYMEILTFGEKLKTHQITALKIKEEQSKMASRFVYNLTLPSFQIWRSRELKELKETCPHHTLTSCVHLVVYFYCSFQRTYERNVFGFLLLFTILIEASCVQDSMLWPTDEHNFVRHDLSS